MIDQILIREFAKRFPNRDPVIGRPPDPVLVIASPNPEIDCVQVWDDDYEATVEVAPFTHGHFTAYEEDSSAEAQARLIVQKVMDFLEALFADQIVIWRAERAAGWRFLEAQDPFPIPADANIQLWTKPYDKSAPPKA